MGLYIGRLIGVTKTHFYSELKQNTIQHNTTKTESVIPNRSKGIKSGVKLK